MPTSYRIIKARYAGNAFDGEGSRSHGGRWSSVGTRIVYTSGSLPLAILEVLVHLQQSEFLSSYVVCKIEFPDDIVIDLNPALIPANWRISPIPAETMEIGDNWIREASSAVLRVPSVIVPSEYNFLINPVHHDFARAKIGHPTPLDVDPRVLEKTR
jgi:RES domain-containing protein